MRKTRIFTLLVVFTLVFAFIAFSTRAKTASATSSVVAAGNNYEIADTMTEVDFVGDGTFINHWGNQAATLHYEEDGSMVLEANQRADQVTACGSYHTKFNVTATGGQLFTIMLRQADSENRTSGTTTEAPNNGYEILTGDTGFQFFEVNNGVRGDMVHWFKYSETGVLGGTEPKMFEIWVLNLNDGTVEFVINVDGENVLRLNTSNEKFKFESPVLTGGMRIGAEDQGVKYTFTKAGKKVNDEYFELADKLTEVDFVGDGTFINHWGNQAATLHYESDGSMVLEANQRADQVTACGSYHTKFDVTATGGQIFTIMLRQADSENRTSGATSEAPNNGYEILTADTGFQFFEVKDGVRGEMVKWFQYNDASVLGATTPQSFEIWVLNLIDGTVQFVINVDGVNRLSLNTTDPGFKFETPVLTGGMRIGAEDQAVKFTFTKFGSGEEKPEKESPYTDADIKDTNGNWILKDAMTEVKFGVEENFTAAWGNQEATVTFDEAEGSMHCKGWQQINSNIDCGSYHAKFDLTIKSGETNWMSLMLRQADRGAVAAGTIAPRNGYGLFASDGGFTIYKWSNDGPVASVSKWFQVETDETKYPNYLKDVDKTITFEIWVLNLADNSIQFIVNIDGVEKLNVNNKTDLNDPEPIHNGYFRIGEPGSSFEGIYKGYENNVESVTVTGTPKTTYTPVESIDLNGMHAVAEYANGIKVSYDVDAKTAKGVNLRQTGNQKMTLDILGETREYDITVNALEGATYTVKEGYQAEYIVGDEFAKDIKVIRNYNGEETEITLLDSEITGFDSITDGVKTLTITIEGQTLTANVNVASYSLKEGYKKAYKVNETYANDIKVLKKIGEQVTEIDVLLEDLIDFSTSTTGKLTYTFTKGVEFSVEITTANYELKEGYKESYKVGEAYKKDIVIKEIIGETVNEITVEDIAGFNTTVSGIIDLKAAYNGIEFDVEFEVYEYAVKTGYKATYEIGEKFANDIKVIKRVGTMETEIDNVTVSGFDSSIAGEKKLTVTVNGETLEATVTVNAEAEKPSKGGCKKSLTLGLAFIPTVIALGVVALKKKEQ